MEQNVIPIGNSAGVIIPAKLRSQIGLQLGSKLVIKIGPDGKSLILSQSDPGQISSITPGFIKTLEGVNRRYGAVLSDLARR